MPPKNSCEASKQPSRSVGTMSDPNDAQVCDFCKGGHVAKRNQQVTFRQWTDKGYVFCRATIPIGVCDHCGSRHWSEDAETIIEDAVRQEYQKLP
jgi:YgiT-type zinc finger domain-containing protein